MVESSLPAPIFALLAAVLFGTSSHLVRLGLAHVDSRTGLTISIGATAATYLLFAPHWMRSEDWVNPGLLIFAAYGIVHPLLSRYMAYEANRRVGATISSSFEGASPLLSAALAILVLGERLTPLLIVGTLLTSAGLLHIYWNPEMTRSVMRVAALLALGAMALRAGLNIVGKVGLDLMPNPAMAAFTGYSVSFICALALGPLWRRRGASSYTRAGIGWFGCVGVMTAGAAYCFYSALLHGQVVVVSPIVSTTPLFALAAGWVFRMERLTWRNIAGVLVTMVGAVIVSMAATME